jgi:hypothetical protein
MALSSQNCSSADATSSTPTPTVTNLKGSFSWKRAAKILQIEVSAVEELVSKGQLKLVDTFVTDRSFEEFCRKHGSLINMSLLDLSTRKWLAAEYDVPDCAVERALPRAQKHALIIRVCKCGRRIAGNVYFRHVRHCREMKLEGSEIKSRIA